MMDFQRKDAKLQRCKEIEIRSLRLSSFATLR
jgi:hypothetical protein